MTDRSLTAEEEALQRRTHLYPRHLAFSECIVCRLLATLDADRANDTALDVKRLARAMELARPAIEKADSVGLRYRAIHSDLLCARDEQGCGCLCDAAAAIAREYAFSPETS